MAFSLKKNLPFEKRKQSVPYKKPFIYAAFSGEAYYLLILRNIGVHLHQGCKIIGALSPWHPEPHHFRLNHRPHQTPFGLGSPL